MRTATIFYSDGCIHRHNTRLTNPELRKQFAIGKKFYTDTYEIVSIKALTIE
ncbi:hypothetical protein [Tenacibaculum sp. 190524A02b]|uniref:hypothetical protein n=1 Tax=Tenacibaculum vairaonense TaxID=3137860 RepID=UPI0031FACFEB